MIRSLADRLSYANVVSTLCLFLVLGGGAWAANKLAKNSVGSEQIKANAVKSAEIKTRAVKDAELGDGSVSTAKLADDAVGSPEVRDGSLGAADLAPPEPWHEVGPGSQSQDLCADPANTAVFCSHPPGGPGSIHSPWENFGSGYATAGFYRDQLGIVHLKGLVTGPNVASTNPLVRRIFRLPAGYRPESKRLFTSNGRDDINNQEVATGRLDVNPDGSIYFTTDCNLSTCSATGAFVSLDGITFRPDG